MRVGVTVAREGKKRGTGAAHTRENIRCSSPARRKIRGIAGEATLRAARAAQAARAARARVALAEHSPNARQSALARLRRSRTVSQGQGAMPKTRHGQGGAMQRSSITCAGDAPPLTAPPCPNGPEAAAAVETT